MSFSALFSSKTRKRNDKIPEVLLTELLIWQYEEKNRNAAIITNFIQTLSTSETRSPTLWRWLNVSEMTSSLLSKPVSKRRNTFSNFSLLGAKNFSKTAL